MGSDADRRHMMVIQEIMEKIVECGTEGRT